MTELKFNNKGGNNPGYALKCFITGLKMLTQPGLRKFLIVPLVINLLLYSVTLGLGYVYVGELIDQFIPGWLEWLSWLIWPLFLISFFMIGFFTFTLLANLIAAPFYSQLAAKTLLILTGQIDTTVVDQGVMKSVMSEMKRILYLLLRAIPLLILFIVPGVNIIAPILWLLFSAWSMALEYMAYPLENQGLLFPEQRQTAKSVRIGTLSFGALVVLGLSIPLINILVPPAAVIAATCYFYGLQEGEV